MRLDCTKTSKQSTNRAQAMKNGQKMAMTVNEGVMIRGLVSHSLNYQLLTLARMIRDQSGLDFGVTFQMVISHGINSLKAARNV
jgi:hypothetical protein